MTDATVAISTDLEDPDAIDLDGLAASLDRLRAQYCQAGAETDAASSSPDVCEPIVLTGSDEDPHLDGLNRSAVLLNSAQLPIVAQVAVRNAASWFDKS